MNNNSENFNVYQINSEKSITIYYIVRLNGKYKTKKRCEESFISSSDCIQRLLELEDKGYSNINVLLCLLNNKDIYELFEQYKAYTIENKTKTLKYN